VHQQGAHTERGAAAAAAADAVYGRHCTSAGSSRNSTTTAAATVRRRPASASHTRQASCPPVLLRGSDVVSGVSHLARRGSAGTLSVFSGACTLDCCIMAVSTALSCDYRLIDQSLFDKLEAACACRCPNYCIECKDVLAFASCILTCLHDTAVMHLCMYSSGVPAQALLLQLTPAIAQMHTQQQHLAAVQTLLMYSSSKSSSSSMQAATVGVVRGQIFVGSDRYLQHQL
jgi:hypothetical protein